VHKYIPEVNRVYSEKRNQVDKQRRILLKVKGVIRMLQKFRRKQGPDLDTRATRIIGFSFMLGVQTIKQTLEIKARSVLKKLAEDAKSMEEMKSRVVQTVDTIRVIQKRWKDIRLIRSFQQEIVKNMWDKEIEVVENY
jgi:DNA-binding ferritin-like protein